jgi:branched-chain amino acid aminotransferase
VLWFEGRLQPGPVAPFDLTDRGLLLGDGLFDTALGLEGRIVFEEAHVARLVAGARTLGFSIEPEPIREAMRALAASLPRAAIRTNATRGSGPRGLAPPGAVRPVLWATAAPWDSALAFAPLRLLPVAVRRNETSVAAGVKTLGYLDAVLAAGEAKRRGFDEALFRNTGGEVACAGTGNLFAVFGDTLVTPPLADGVLPGIVRAEILERIAPSLGLAVQERSLSLEALEEADAVILTNSLRLLAPVETVGATGFGSATNPTVARLAEALGRAVARDCGVAVETLR